MKLRAKFTIAIVLITAAMSAVAIFVVTKYVEDRALSRAQQLTAEYIRAKAVERLDPWNFGDGNFFRQKETFQTFMTMIKTPEIIKIKVFNARFDIVYSTNDLDIGKKTDSVNYRNSLLGRRVLAVIKPPETEAANIDMLGYRQVMEVYVPILFQEQAAGVIEVYFKMDAINDAIREISRFVIAIIVAFSLAVVAAVYLFLTFLVVKPLRTVGAAIDRLAAGEKVEMPKPHGRDEIGTLTASLRRLIDKDRGA